MRRASTLAAVAALLLLPLLPSASASGAGLAIEVPEGPLQVVDGAATEALTVHVLLDSAVCSAEADVHVRLRAYAPGGATASVPEEVIVRVPAGGYVSHPYDGTAQVDLLLQTPSGGSGHVMVAGGYDLPSSCVAAGESSASVQVDVAFEEASAASPQPEPQPQPPSVPPPEPQRQPQPSSSGDTIVAQSGSHLDVVPWALGLGIAAVLAFALGRLGQRGQAGGRDELP